MAFTKSLVAAALALSSVVSAVPVERRSNGTWWGATATTTEPPTGLGRPTSTPSFVSAVGKNGELPLANGFPNVTNPSPVLDSIFDQAHGTLPKPAKGAPAAAPPKNDTLTSLQLIAFNEIWEVFFFTELLTNITSNVEGFVIEDDKVRTQIIEALTVVQAQEELHALNANGALKANGLAPIEACQYHAGISSWQAGLLTASTFTDVVLGTLGDVIVDAGIAGDAGLTRGFASVIGQEGEQNGFYHAALGFTPSTNPFLTASTREWAFSAINQGFVIPYSCPNSNTIDLPIFGTLTALTQNIGAKTPNVTFQTTNLGDFTASAEQIEEYSLVLINQQNAPVVLPISHAVSAGSTGVTFTAPFPFEENDLIGLTIAVVAKGKGPFNNVTAAAEATIFGPALIEVQI